MQCHNCELSDVTLTEEGVQCSVVVRLSDALTEEGVQCGCELSDVTLTEEGVQCGCE